ncbi:MAG: hypothetical protein QOE32_4540, partial [Pseudonocardiales bacterium]|nr:hypothetical protein [Pseudonocardiales bacterium]
MVRGAYAPGTVPLGEPLGEQRRRELPGRFAT